MDLTTRYATSSDGTAIAYEPYGSGPAVVLVGGAFNDVATLRPLAAALAPHTTAITYDRRGRGASTDAAAPAGVPPVRGAVERELDDIDALVDAAGGAAALFGYSSGGHLALLASARSPRITALAMFEPPFAAAGRAEPSTGLAERIHALVADGRRGDAVTLFQTAALGMSEETAQQMRRAPFYPQLEALAPSLVYDTAVTGLHPAPRDAGARVRVPTAVLHGRDTWPGLVASSRAAADAVPGAELRAVEGADHALVPGAVAAAVVDLLRRAAAAVDGG